MPTIKTKTGIECHHIKDKMKKMKKASQNCNKSVNTAGVFVCNIKVNVSCDI